MEKISELPNYYEVFKIEKSSSTVDIKKAFRRMALKYHPDKGGDAEKMKLLNEAYRVLMDPEQRKQFDEDLEFFVDEKDWAKKQEKKLAKLAKRKKKKSKKLSKQSKSKKAKSKKSTKIKQGKSTYIKESIQIADL